MKVVGLDLGERRIGVAVSSGVLAFPRPCIERSGKLDVDDASIAAVIEEVGARTLVIGLPLSLRGTEGQAARAVRSEAQRISGVLSNIDVVLFDERLSTVSAQRGLFEAGKTSRAQRTIRDSAAAVVILQSWLEAQ